MGFADAVHLWEEWQLRVLVLSSLFLQYFLMVVAAMRKRSIPPWFRFLTWLAYLGSDAIAIYALAALFNRHWKSKEGHADNGSLEALWAPILLVHLGGQDGITAYNIEDNELWRRHVLTAVSQIAVAIYVFRKSWSGDKKLLQAAICIFATGILKCFEKPLALKSASINSLMNRNAPSSDTDLLFEGEVPARDALYNLFVDIVPSDSTQICRILNLTAYGDVHDKLQSGLSESFDRLYTKEQVFSVGKIAEQGFENYLLGFGWKRRCGYLLRTLVFYLTLLAIRFFSKSHREGYNPVDVKITYALLWGTAVLETIMGGLLVVLHIITSAIIGSPAAWSEQVAQYNLMGYLVRNRKHWMLRKIAALVFCKEYLDQLWCMKPCKSSRGITKLVHGYIQKWLVHHVQDQAMIFRGFNNSRGHWILKEEGFGESTTVEAILRRPFDESVLLWHLTTDFCFHHMDTSPSHSVAFRCRVMSNYMAYLLFMNPEMLITGARRSLFRATCKKLGDFALDETGLDERELTKMIIQKVKGMEGEGIVHGAWALAEELMDSCREDEEKMWRVIQGVWVEMLGFSASRCRGYLHAKSLGKGGEYLSYVWLLLSYMGIETLAEKMQSTELVSSDIQQGRFLVQNIRCPGTVPVMLY